MLDFTAISYMMLIRASSSAFGSDSYPLKTLSLVYKETDKNRHLYHITRMCMFFSESLDFSLLFESKNRAGDFKTIEKLFITVIETNASSYSLSSEFFNYYRFNFVPYICTHNMPISLSLPLSVCLFFFLCLSLSFFISTSCLCLYLSLFSFSVCLCLFDTILYHVFTHNMHISLSLPLSVYQLCCFSFDICL